MILNPLILFTNWLKACPAIVTDRNGERVLVSALCRESNGNWYVFHWPYKQRDIGFSVNPKYIQWPSRIGNLYVWLAGKAVRQFPKWITV